MIAQPHRRPSQLPKSWLPRGPLLQVSLVSVTPEERCPSPKMEMPGPWTSLWPGSRPLHPESILFRTKNTGGLGAGGRGSGGKQRKRFGAQRLPASQTRTAGASEAAGARAGPNNSRKRGAAAGRAWERAASRAGFLQAQLGDRARFLWERASGALPSWRPLPPRPCPPRRFYFYFGKMQKNKAEIASVEIYWRPAPVSDPGTEGLGLPSTPCP